MSEITPGGVINGDDWIVDAWIYGDYPAPQPIVVRAIRGDESDEHGLQDYHITLRADQACGAGRNRPPKLAEVAQEPVPAAAPPRLRTQAEIPDSFRRQ